jgi:hypothetical protein
MIIQKEVTPLSLSQKYSFQSKTPFAGRVTRWVRKSCTKWSPARFFVKTNMYLTCILEKKYRKNLRYFCNFSKTAQSKPPPNRRKFAQSGPGLPDGIFSNQRFPIQVNFGVP